MNWELIKSKLCRLAVTATLVLAGTILAAAAGGSMPFWAALLGLAASVVLLNTLCGVLLGSAPAQAQPEAEPASEPRAVTLRVVRGGRAA